MNATQLIAALSIGVMGASAMATVYTDQATFLGGLSASYTNGFDDAVFGPSPDLNYSSGGFAYTVSASGTGTNSLFNDTGLISTDSAVDGILVSFTGAAVTAVGGNFWATDINVFPTGTDVMITLSDGTTESFTSTGPSDFRGFTSSVAISSIFIDAPDDVTGTPFWATMDNLTVGTAVPTPGAAALLGLAGLGATRRRRA